MTVGPAETVCFVIFLVKGRMLQINLIQIFHEMVKCIVDGVGQNIPVLFPFLIPFSELSQLISHEIQFLARVGIHIHIESPCLGEFLIVFSVHFLHDGSLAVNYFVMGERKQKSVIVIVHHRKCQFVIALRAVFGTGAEIVQRVVHPTHIPFVIKSEPAFADRSCDAGVGGGIFRRKYGVGVELLKSPVHLADEFYGSVVDASGRFALPVNDPADGIHADSVYMVLGEPVVGGGLKKTPYFAPGVHEIIASPFADPHIVVWIFIKRSSIVAGKSIAVHRKMYRHEIQDYADVIQVTLVYEFHQFCRSAVAGGGTEKPGVLIAPGLVTGVFAKGHDLHVVVPVFFQIRNQNTGKLRISIPVIRLIGRFPEGAEMNLIDVHRSVPAV